MKQFVPGRGLVRRFEPVLATGSPFAGFYRLLKLFNPKVAEPVELAFFTVMLERNDTGSIHRVVHLGGGDTVYFDFDVPPFAGDAVSVPPVAFECLPGPLTERSLALRIALDRADKPHPSALVVKTARPVPWRAVHLGLVTINLVGFGMGSEHKTTVCSAFRQKHFPLEDEVRIAFLRDDKKLLFTREMDLAVHDLCLAPRVRILPAGEGFPVKKRHENFRVGSGLDARAASEGGEKHREENASLDHGVR